MTTLLDVKPPLYVTQDISIARDYALRLMVGAQKPPANAVKQPTIYTLDVDPGQVLDLRTNDHKKLYEIAWKDACDKWDPSYRLPRLESEGFLMSTSGLPGYGYVRGIRALLPQFDSIWIDEGTQGISLALFNPKGTIVSVKKL